MIQIKMHAYKTIFIIMRKRYGNLLSKDDKKYSVYGLAIILTCEHNKCTRVYTEKR